MIGRTGTSMPSGNSTPGWSCKSAPRAAGCGAHRRAWAARNLMLQHQVGGRTAAWRNGLPDRRGRSRYQLEQAVQLGMSVPDASKTLPPLIAMDVDDFKADQRRHGHGVGADPDRHGAPDARLHPPRIPSAGPLGDEFMLVAAQHPVADAPCWWPKLRQRLEPTPGSRGGASHPETSGLVGSDPDAGRCPADGAVWTRALYRAKLAGRISSAARPASLVGGDGRVYPGYGLTRIFFDANPSRWFHARSFILARCVFNEKVPSGALTALRLWLPAGLMDSLTDTVTSTSPAPPKRWRQRHGHCVQRGDQEGPGHQGGGSTSRPSRTSWAPPALGPTPVWKCGPMIWVP